MVTETDTDPGSDAFQHDVFISYAREDTDWVMSNLYERLLRCRTDTGTRARIFLDVGPEGLLPGVDWTDKLAAAITTTRVFVPVYSATYFNKEMCQWELSMAFTQDPTGRHGRLSPVLIEPEAEKLVPHKMRAINYVVTWRDDWFAMVCNQLGLRPERSLVRLEFLYEPADTYVNHTLAPVLVRASSGEGTPAGLAGEEEVTLSATTGTLAGTVTVTTTGGVATFEDLSIQTALERTSLVAEAPGCIPAESAPFAVRREPASVDAAGQRVPVRDARRVLFLPGADRLAILTGDRAAVYELDGEEVDAVPLSGPPRLVRSGGTAIGLAGWSGDSHVLRADGGRLTWHAVPADGGRLTWAPDPAPQRQMAVPGDMVVLDDGAYVGFWSGAIYRLLPGEEPRHQAHQERGVQAMALAGDLLCVADLAGGLHLSRDGEQLAPLELEPAIHLLKGYPGYLVAVGDRAIYQIPLETGEVFTDQHQLGEPVAAFVDTDVPLVIDQDGRGVAFDRDLVIRVRFHTVAGAVPTSADREGRHYTFRNPDGSGSLMRDGRVVLTHPAGPLAVSPAGDRLALGDAEGITVLSMDAIDGHLAT